MRIKKIQIKNFKSLVDFELDEPKPFCAFVGPNASGKSNIFEALEFVNFVSRFSFEAPGFFGGKDAILSYNKTDLSNHLGIRDLEFEVFFKDNFIIYFDARFSNESKQRFESIGNVSSHKDDNIPVTEISNLKIRQQVTTLFKKRYEYEQDLEIFIDNFSRIFSGNSKFERPPSIDKLHIDASNLSQIIGKIFQDENKREDFVEWLRILIPEFENIEIKQSNIDGSFDFFIYEKSSGKAFPKHLISDGTYNILALMAAVFQSNQPQFLCIEEPENGLHPEAIELLVDFFREKCETEGHHIWLNTHSPTLIRCLEVDEVVLVNKINGETRAKKISNLDAGIKTDEAWLSNALGGGVSWSK